MRTLWQGMVLNDNADNATAIISHADEQTHDAQLRSRTLKIEGMSAGAKAFSSILLNFKDVSEATGIEVISKNSDNSDYSDSSDRSANWYTIDGTPLPGTPSAKGIYIRNGRKVVID